MTLEKVTALLTAFSLQFESLSYLATIISAVVVAATLVFTYKAVKLSAEAVKLSAEAVKLSTEDFKERNKKDRFSGAIEIAREYASLIDDISYIQAVIVQDEKLLSILNKLRPELLKEFNTTELEMLINEEDRGYLYAFFRNGNINLEMMLFNYELRNMCLPNFAQDVASREDAKSRIKILMAREYYDVMQLLLNKLEYISMALNLNVADEETLFPSLHHSFLMIVHLLYFPIAIINKNYSDKFYTNITTLYETWINRDAQNKLNEAATINKIDGEIAAAAEKKAQEIKKCVSKQPEPIKK